MAKILSAKEAKLQKKLIPLNIFVFILSLVAALSLIFAPIIKINAGKILRDENVIAYAGDTLEKLIENNIGTTTEEGFQLNFTPIIAAAVVEVLGKAKGTIEFSTFEVCRYAADGREDKLKILLEGIVYGRKGIVTELVNSLVEDVAGTFTSEEGKGAVEEAVVDSFISSIGGIVDSVGGEQGSEVAEVIKEKVTGEKAQELKETFLEINNVKSEEDVVNVIDKFVDRLNDTLGDEYISQENKEAVTGYIVDIYKETLDAIEASGDENQEFSLEAMICVAISRNVNLDGIDINKLLQDYVDQLSGSGSEEGPSTASKALTEGEDGEETGDGTGGDSESPSTSKPPLSYSELFSGVGLDSDKLGKISDKLNKIVEIYVDDNLESINNSLKETGWIYQWIYFLILAGIMVFVIPWLILALAAFIRTFTKNKRYMMWYVKLLGFIPALIFVALFVIKTWGSTLIFSGMAEETLSLVTAALGGISSFTWICGLCYIALWLVSIFWAFPIKRKIRKERKACKNAKSKGAYDYSDYEDDYGYSVSKNKKRSYAYDDDDDYGYDDAYDDDGDYSYGDYGFDDDDDDDDYDDDY